MASAGLRGTAVASPRPRSRADHAAPFDVGTAAWVAVLPVVAVALFALFVVGPPLGRLLFSGHGSYRFLPDVALNARPEPTEHARYLLLLGVAALLAVAIALAARRRPRVAGPFARGAAVAAQLLLGGLLVACFVVQYRLRYGEVYLEPGMAGSFGMRYFSPATLVVAGALAVAALVAIPRVPSRALAALLHDSRRVRVACALAAVLVTATWLLSAVHTDVSVNSVPWGFRYHLEFTLNEAFAVVNGLTPLVDFSAAYGSLWPFLSALALVTFGKTVLVFTIVMCTISGIALLGVFGVLRRAAGSPAFALALYVPFLATSLFFLEGTFSHPSNVAGYFAAFPLRYAGPFLLAWLTARHVERRGGTAGLLALFTAAGLVLLNNTDFGAAALGASVVALVFATGDLRRRTLLRLAGSLAGGLVLAFALVSLLTLARAGSLPHLWRLVDYAASFAIGGLQNLPINGALGVHVAIYLTYVGAIGLATVRALRRAPNRVLTGMLAWSGVFGLGSAAYWVGRSHPIALKYLFAGWAFAVALLTIAAVQHLRANRTRRPTVAVAAVLFGFAVCACSIAQVPAPWAQVQRLEGSFTPMEVVSDATPLAPATNPRVRAFVTSLADGPSRFVVKPGAPVAILMATGHRIADAYGVRNVSPYTGVEAVVTVGRVDDVIAALRKAGGNTIILPNQLFASILGVLERRGFRLVTRDGLRRFSIAALRRGALVPWHGGPSMMHVPDAVMKWVDTRHLHPRALGGG
jgi:hypothetical protein